MSLMTCGLNNPRLRGKTVSLVLMFAGDLRGRDIIQLSMYLLTAVGLVLTIAALCKQKDTLNVDLHLDRI